MSQIKKKRKAQRLEDEKRGKDNYEEKKELTLEHVVFESDDSGDDVRAMDVKQTDNIPCSNKPIRKRTKKNFIDDKMLACMDVGNISSPLGIRFISATAKALGHNIEDLVLNCTSLREQRKKYRRYHGKETIENFEIPETFVLHWDGKLFPAIVGKTKVDRLAIVLTSENVEKFIAIPIIKNGTGATVAQSVYDYLLKINMLNSLDFDRTSANTGRYVGAVILLDSKLERSLLWLPCRHHIAEILLRAYLRSISENQVAQR